MTSQQLLAKLGITAEQAKEYKTRSSDFASSLPSTLVRLHKKTLNPVPLDRVRKWFGPHVTQSDLAALYKTAPGLRGVVLFTNLRTAATKPPTKDKTKGRTKGKTKRKKI
jgi:hypothetical protein